VRDRAEQWGIDPGRIGFVGFSAGAIAAINLVYTADAATRRWFVGMIYGARDAVLPHAPPPLFARTCSKRISPRPKICASRTSQVGRSITTGTVSPAG
jgi:acetyl esterase/lipase